ncbi:hypothetical protein Angca_000631 [Angiostrongylus cantonensis]|nr:hypothetical protein Angca_000631 [Angiostrongylus cantonensis]
MKIRRSSSLQAPTFEAMKVDDIQLSEVTVQSAPSNLYRSHPNRSQCNENARINSVCLGHCRIEVASCIIGMFSVAISAITMCSLLMTSGSLSSKVQSLVTAPITCLVLFEFATAMLLIIGVLIDAYYLMMPFVLNTVVHACLALGVAIAVVNSSGQIRLLYGPYIVIGCFLVIILYVWFTSVVVMTIIFIRDQQRRRYGRKDHFYNNLLKSQISVT